MKEICQKFYLIMVLLRIMKVVTKRQLRKVPRNRCGEGPFLQPEVFRSPEAKKIAHVIKLNEDQFEQGYDSDGEIGPFFDAIKEEGVQDYDDDEELPEHSMT
jgi:hypothetical protein